MQTVAITVVVLVNLLVASAHPIFDSFDLGDHICDKKVNCSNTATCCHLGNDKEYGCCNLPNAVCCLDFKHCCPSGHTCKVSEGKCAPSSSGKELLTMETIESVVSAPETVTCKDRSTCPTGDTCCKLKNNDGYGCCPMQAAVCCSDGLHCCPTDYFCDKDQKCTDIFLHTVMQTKLRTKPIDSRKTLTESTIISPETYCKDGSYCPFGDTCCSIKGIEYGCCPLSSAVCCSDGLYCCPPNTYCVGDAKCRHYNLNTLLQAIELQWHASTKTLQSPVVTYDSPPNVMQTKLRTKPIDSRKTLTESTIISPETYCKDGSYCPFGDTCCSIKGIEYGCCPLSSAVCCSDGLYCCPPNTYCVGDAKCRHYNLNTLLQAIELQWHASTKTLQSPVVTYDSPPNVMQTKLRTKPIDSRKTLTESTIISPETYCKDGSYCPFGDTCCSIKGIEYGCCPLSSAVCCSDGLYCCPPNTYCVGDAKCRHYNLNTLLQAIELQWHASTKTLQSPVVTYDSPPNVICPDSTKCPIDNTCCKTSNTSNTYGCCPQDNGVCCSDLKHCCPEGYTCDVTDETCTKQGEEMAFFEKISVKKSPETVVCPDQQHKCQDGQTCCKLTSGQYGCCPVPSAVCCSDGVHCCPEGYTCKVSDGTCTKQGETIAFLKKMAAKSPENVVCPDGQSYCQDGQTCCKLSSGQYGCCPIANAVCCSDGIHCCPSDYTCDVSDGTCIKQGETIAFLEKISAKKSPENVVCPDGQSYCQDGQTCCKLSSGQYGCCPIANAVCCSDGIHCCPSGYTCDVSNGTCTKQGETIAFLEKIAAEKTPKSMVCPDGQSECQDGQTCCKLTSGKYGCCPLMHAVCCTDGTHCCPEGYVCQSSSGTCSKQEKTITFLEIIAALSPKNVVCPDGTSECQDGQTCCKLSSGMYGCCPIANAVCCSDGIHCCPSGYTCDVSAGTCTKQGETIAFFEKISAKKSPQNVVCPDGTSECQDGQTCCKLSSGMYGCCPIANAVCCSDGIHCCPSGYTCDVSAGTCTKQGETIAFFEKISAKKSPQNVVCPDGTSECQDGQTCCKLSSGMYGCCPIANAVCCSDGIHCCPSGYTCDVSAGTCTKQGETIAFFEKISAKKSPQNVVCPDGTSECQDGQTCCKLSSGMYGCCPIANAVCCSDGIHCCPSGYTCDVSAGTCTKQGETIAFFEKISAKKSPQNVVCPDGTSECQDGQTCCKLSSGMYGCCPIANAVCCSDGIHCCPSGYTCDVSAGTCTKQGETIAFFEKISAKKSPQNVVCPDGTSECQDGQTCCKLSSGMYGCCPIANAVCCSDGIHCCPSGYTCDVSAGTCTKGETVAFLEKISAKKFPESVMCLDKQTQCPDGSTCCKGVSGQWACCPASNAVCCSDGYHCCPGGYTCDVDNGNCDKEGEKIPLLKKVFPFKPSIQNLDFTKFNRDIL